jgi:hypothetical protein
VIGIGPRGVLTASGLLGPVVLTGEELQVLVAHAAVAEMPVVLDHRHDHDTAAGLAAALAAAEDSLVARGLLRSGVVHPELGDRVRILGLPRWEIAVRRFRDGDIERLCVAHDSAEHGVSETAGRTVSALRVPGGYVLDEVVGSAETPIVSLLGPAAPLGFGSASAPTDRVSDALTAGAGNPSGTAKRLVEAGVAPGAAGVLGAALAPCRIFAELVGIRHGDGLTAPVGGPVTVFYTPAGRVVGTSSVAGDGTAWTTLSPGTTGFLRQALTALRDLLDDRSSPSNFRR